MPRLLLLLLFTSIHSYLWAQANSDTFRFGPHVFNEAAFKESNWTVNERDISLENRVIPYDSFYNLVGALIVADKTFKKYLGQRRFEIPSAVSIRNCDIIPDDSLLDKFHLYVGDSLRNFLMGDIQARLLFREGLFIRGCSSKEFVTISGITTPSEKTFQLVDNRVGWLRLDSLDCADVALNDNDIKFISIDNSKIDQLSFLSNSSSDTTMFGAEMDKFFFGELQGKAKPDLSKLFFLSLDNSEVGSINIGDAKADWVILELRNTKVEKGFSFMDSLPEFGDMKEMFSYIQKMIKAPASKTKKLDATFERCEINGELSNSIHSRISHFTFDGCSFGEKADLGNLSFDTLTIMNCYKIASPLYLSIPDSSDVYISITNSDLKNIRFDYTRNVHLIADVYGDGNEDVIAHSYISLLEKFKMEGKLKSYENLDVEYLQWKYKKSGFFGHIANAIDRYWWYYGYRKWYILYWTFIFLALFTVANFIWWDKFNSVYPVPGKSSESYFEKVNYRSRMFNKTIHVFLATTFVFLSFRVELDRLNYKRSSLLLYFFLQYTIGLICLFFIFNAILKI